MSTPTAPTRPWYDNTGLVVALCVLLFPLGLFALWKSNKYTTIWKITGTSLVALLIIAFAAANGETADQNAVVTKSETVVKQPAVTQPVAVAEKDQTVLFASAEQFRKAFNNFTVANTLEMEVGEIKVTEGSVNNTFTNKFNKNLVLVGTLDKNSGAVKEITMIGSGDGTATSGGNILICIGAIIAAVDPTLAADQRIGVLKQLGLLGDTGADVMNLSTKTDRNGYHYFLNSSEQIGIMFGASKSKE